MTKHGPIDLSHVIFFIENIPTDKTEIAFSELISITNRDVLGINQSHDIRPKHGKHSRDTPAQRDGARFSHLAEKK